MIPIFYTFKKYTIFLISNLIPSESEVSCIFVTICAPKPLIGSLVKTAKVRLPYLLGIGVILLQIGDEIILDKREKRYIRNY